jgi:hypothetical protein
MPLCGAALLQIWESTANKVVLQEVEIVKRFHAPTPGMKPDSVAGI